MKRIIVIEPYENLSSVNYYVIRFKDEQENEFDKFFNKFDGDQDFEKDFDIIIEWLEKIGEEGADIQFFRPEGLSLKALPIQGGKLRLYCFRVSECIILLGNGGNKKTRTYQEDPMLNKYVSDLREVGRHLMNRHKNGTKTNIHNCEIKGSLEFEIETDSDKQKTDYEKE